MKTLRKKTGKRKEMLNQPDEFQSLTQRAIDYVQDNTKQVMTVLAVAGAVAVGALLFGVWKESTAKGAATRQAEALKYYDVNSPAPGGKPMGNVERLTKAKDLFGDVARNYGGAQADMAKYYKANAEMELGQFDEAIKGYTDLLAGLDNPELAALVKRRLAAAHLEKGSADEAVKIYMDEVKSGRYLKDEAYFALGRIYMRQGKNDDAMRAFKAVEKDYPKSQYAPEAKQMIAMLGGAPSEIFGAPDAGGAPLPIQITPAPAPAGKQSEGAIEITPSQAPAPAEKK